MNKHILKLYLQAQDTFSRRINEMTTEYRGLPLPMKVGAALLFLSSYGFAGNIANTLTQQASQIICSITRFLVGPVSWAFIVGALIIGVIMLAVGGRGALRWVILSIVAAIILVAGKTYFSSQIDSGDTATRNCIGIGSPTQTR